ncbi:ABC transporter substrate-binding protein [Treponema sp.]
MKKLRFLSVLLIIALSLISVDVFASGTGESSGPVKIRVGTMPNHIGAPIQYAYEKGMYKEAGLDVEVILFPTGAPINEALSAEKIDLAGSGMASVFALASGDTYWLGDYVKTVAGLGVYVRPDSPVLKEKGNVPGKPNVYGSKQTVKGLVILGALGTSDQFESVAWAQSLGLTGNDIQMLNMDRGPAVQAFKTGQGDAIACGGPPYNYELEKAGYIQAAGLTDVSGMNIADGMLGRKKFIDAHSEEVKKFVEITYKVIDQFYASDTMVAEYAMDFYNKNGKNYTKSMMLGEINDKDYIGKKSISAPDYFFGSTMIGMGGFYVADGKIEANLKDNITKSMRPDFLEGIYGNKLTIYPDK